MYSLIKAAFQAWYEKKFCKHEWEHYKTINTFDNGCQRPWKSVDYLSCKKCGTFKKINL